VGSNPTLSAIYNRNREMKIKLCMKDEHPLEMECEGFDFVDDFMCIKEASIKELDKIVPFVYYQKRWIDIISVLEA
jgi:hypothetical protein